MVLIWLLIGWVVVAPALVVSGLYVAAGVLGRRASVTGVDVTGMAADLADLAALWAQPTELPSGAARPAATPIAH